MSPSTRNLIKGVGGRENFFTSLSVCPSSWSLALVKESWDGGCEGCEPANVQVRTSEDSRGLIRSDPIRRLLIFSCPRSLLIDLGPEKEARATRCALTTLIYRRCILHHIYINMVPFRNWRAEVVPKSINFPGLY